MLKYKIMILIIMERREQIRMQLKMKINGWMKMLGYSLKTKKETMKLLNRMKIGKS